MTVKQLSDSQALVAVLAENAETRGAEHPDIDRLLEYHSGELSSEAAAQVLEHLVSCRRCAQILLDLESFPDLETSQAESSNVVDLATVAGWRDFKSRLDDADLPARSPQAAPTRALYALAASLLVGVLGLSFWVAELRQSVDQAYMAQTNPMLVTLAPITRTDGPEGLLVEVPRERPIFWLRVIPGTLESFSSIEAELTDADGRKVWSDGDIELTEAGSFRVSFSRRSLPAGDYRMQVFGHEGDRREILVDQELRVRYP